MQRQLILSLALELLQNTPTAELITTKEDDAKLLSVYQKYLLSYIILLYNH